MSIRGPHWFEYRVRRIVAGIEKSIQGDVAMGNVDEIHHIWIHPENARCIRLYGTGPHSYQFKVNGVLRTFLVEVSINRPKSVLKEADEYYSATVDKNGWVVGQRTIEEAFRIPVANRLKVV